MRSGLRSTWPSTVGVALLVAVVGTAVLTLAAGVARTLSAPDRYSASFGDDFDLSLEQFSGRPRAEEVAALPSVAGVEAASFVFGGLQMPGASAPIESFVFAGSPLAFGAQVVDGRAPDAAEPGEFVATRSWLELANLELGAELSLVTITQSEADERGFDVAEPAGPLVLARLVGVVAGPNEIQDPTPLALFPSTLLDVGDVGVASTVGVVALAPGATSADLRADLDALPDGEQFGLGPAEWVPEEVRTAVRTQAQGLGVVAVIVALASVAVVGQLLSRRVRLASSARRIMSAIGLTRAQVVADPVCSTAIPVVAGVATAAVVSVSLSGVFPIGFARDIEPAPGWRFEPVVHIAGPVLLVAALLTWVGLASVVGALDGRAIVRPGLAEQVAGHLPFGPAAAGLRLALTRHPSDPGVARVPLLGLVLVLVLLVGALVLGASVARFIDEPARYGTNFDVATGVGGDTVPREVLAVLDDTAEIADVTLYGTVLATVGTTTFDLIGLDARRGRLEPEVLDGRLARAADELVLGRVTARALDVGIDDEVTVVGSAGPVTFRVSGMAILPSIEGADGIGDGGLVTLDGLRSVDPEAALGVAAVRFRSASGGAAQRLGEQIGFSLGPPDRPPAVVNLARAQSTPFLVAAALAALAGLSLAHQLLTSTRRRRRDLAVIQALGADRQWVAGALHWQATILAVVVVVVALPLGVGAGRVVYQAYMDRLGARADLSVPLDLLAAVTMSTVLLGNLAALVPVRRVRLDAPGAVLAEA
ncbi:MAG: FtsX-like permease family protein [Acidimicrobiales bacterium]